MNSSIRNITIPPILSRLILNYINQKTEAEKLTARIKDDPFRSAPSEKAYGLRSKQAKSIIVFRKTLPAKMLETVDQITDVEGIGVDTLYGIIFSFKRLSAE